MTENKWAELFSYLSVLIHIIKFFSYLSLTIHCASEVFSSCHNSGSEYKQASQWAFYSWHHGQKMYGGLRVNNRTSERQNTDTLRCFSCFVHLWATVHIFIHDILKGITTVSHTVNKKQEHTYILYQYIFYDCVSRCYLQTVYNWVNKKDTRKMVLR